MSGGQVRRAGRAGWGAGRSGGQARPLWRLLWDFLGRSKNLGMALPGVEYAPMSLESILKLSRAPPQPHIPKSKKIKNQGFL